MIKPSEEEKKWLLSNFDDIQEHENTSTFEENCCGGNFDNVSKISNRGDKKTCSVTNRSNEGIGMSFKRVMHPATEEEVSAFGYLFQL